jgi:hypothetical protein
MGAQQGRGAWARTVSSMRAEALASDQSAASSQEGRTRADRQAVRPVQARRSRGKRGSPVLGVLLFLSAPLSVSLLAGSIIPALVALLLVLPVLVLANRRLPAPVGSSQGPELVTPWQLSLAVVVVTGFGSLAAVVLSLFLNGLGIGGSGGPLLEALLAGCVLVPCFSLGTLCGRWWSFSSSLPVLCLLIVAPSLLALIAFAAISCSLALGSLHRASHARHAAARRVSRRPRPR